MKILSVDYNKVNSMGGIQKFNRNLNAVFNSEISFLTIYGSSEEELENEYCFKIPNNIVFKSLNYLFKYKLFSRLVSYRVNSIDPDVIICNSPSLVRYLPKNKSIVLVQHQDYKTMLLNKSNFGHVSYFNEVLDKVDSFVVLSPYDKDEIKMHCKESVYHKIRCIRHMYEGSLNYLKKSHCNRSLVMVSRLDIKQKRLDLAIKAMKHLQCWNLHIYGDGPDRNILEKLVMSLNLENVFFYGFESNIPSIMRQYDIHIMTSDFEGYGFTNIEAMSVGLPIIVRDTFTSAKDLIQGNGVLLGSEWSESEFISAVCFIESNYEAMSKQSFELSQRYKPEQIASCWKELLQSLSNKHPKQVRS